MRLRSIEAADWSVILRLNEESVELVSPLDRRAMGWFVRHAYRTVAVEAEGAVVAFALALIAGSDYESPNYRWFGERYGQFLYLDRIVVDVSWRRRGIATMVYDATEDLAAAFGRQLCEVYLEPPNLESLGFHAARGYEEVGQLAVAGGKTRSMLAKELPGGSSVQV
jgi:predicted GNAT superfamily acetyltransferase